MYAVPSPRTIKSSGVIPLAMTPTGPVAEAMLSTGTLQKIDISPAHINAIHTDSTWLARSRKHRGIRQCLRVQTRARIQTPDHALGGVCDESRFPPNRTMPFRNPALGIRARILAEGGVLEASSLQMTYEPGVLVTVGMEKLPATTA